jgi:hypothetical protein
VPKISRRSKQPLEQLILCACIEVRTNRSRFSFLRVENLRVKLLSRLAAPTGVVAVVSIIAQTSGSLIC